MISRPDLRWKRCDIKSTNLLANVLASEAARRAGCHEAVLIDSEGFVTEATHSSLLWVRNERLEGTPDGHEILPGMTRGLILRLVRPLGIPFAGARVTLPALIAADEVILVGTTYEVLPVIEIDGKTIGSGTPGPVARRLAAAYRQEIERWLAGPTALCLGVWLRTASIHLAGARMTTTEELDDPLSIHFRRDPLPDAGIRVVLLTDSSAETAAADHRAPGRADRGAGRAVEERVISVDERGLAEALRRGLEGASLPLVLVTTAIEPWTADHLEPLLKAIDKSDHVVGRRDKSTAGSFKSFIGWLFRRLIFAVPLDDVHSPCRLHRLEKLLAIPLAVGVVVSRHRDPGEGDFSGHLIDEVDVPPLPCHVWDRGWSSDRSRILKHPQFVVQSNPSEEAQGQRESHDGPGGEDQDGIPHVVRTRRPRE